MVGFHTVPYHIQHSLISKNIQTYDTMASIYDRETVTVWSPSPLLCNDGVYCLT